MKTQDLKSEFLNKKHNRDILVFIRINKIESNTLKDLAEIAKSEHRYDIANRINTFLERNWNANR